MLNRFVSFAATVIFLSVPSTLLAENVSYLGVEFPITELSDVEGGQKKVTIGDKSFLVSATDLSRKVAHFYASDPALLDKALSWEKVSKLLKNLVEVNDPLAVTVLQATFRSQTFLPAEVGESLFALVSETSSSAMVESAITSFDGQLASPHILCETFSTLSAASRRVLQERATRLIYRLAYQCTEYLQKRAQQNLTEGALATGMRYLDTITQLFADGSQSYLPLVTARNRLAKLETAITSGDYLGVARQLKTLSEDPWLDPFSVNVRRSVVQLAIESSLQEQRVTHSLRLIPSIDFQRRTPKDHQLILKVLECVTPREREAFLSDPVALALVAFARKDADLREGYLKTLSTLLNESLHSVDIQGVETILQRILSVRPDPSRENDAIRTTIVERLLSAGYVREARVASEEVSSSIPLTLKIRLLFAGAYIEVGILLCLIASIFLGVVFILWGRRTRLSPPRGGESERGGTARNRSADTNEESEEEGGRPRFVVYSHGLKIGQALDEYEECLRVFSLKPGVSLQRIKVAYRNAVKTCHPDLNPNAGESEAARFIQLTRTYEKLLQLHELRTGER